MTSPLPPRFPRRDLARVLVSSLLVLGALGCDGTVQSGPGAPVVPGAGDGGAGDAATVDARAVEDGGPGTGPGDDASRPARPDAGADADPTDGSAALPDGVAPALLARALGEVVRRHRVLRTVFRYNQGQARQVVCPFAPSGLPLIDLSGLPSEKGLAAARALAEAQAAIHFDLEQGPLYDFRCLRLHGGGQVLLANMHHIITDGWSMGLFQNEVTAIYAAFAQGRPNPLPELAVQYGDFSRWQHDWLQGDVLDRQRDYWKAKLDGDPATLELPADFRRAGMPSTRGATVALTLPEELARDLRALAREADASTFMLMLAAFQVLVARLSGSRDFCVGTPVSGRGREEIENLIGYFVNTLVLRADANGDPSFRQFLSRVRQTVLEAFAHQDYPFEKLVSELVSERDVRHTPLFQVMFALYESSAAAPESAAAALIEAIRPNLDIAKFELTLSVENLAGVGGSGPMILMLEYKTDLFRRETIARFADCYQTLLQAIVAGADRAIDDLELLTESQRHELLQRWHVPDPDWPRNDTIPSLFAAARDRDPQHIALQDGDFLLTYAELDERASRLADWLASHGAGPESTIALCLPRGAQAVLAMMGALKAGSAYVPIDPKWPTARIAFILEDTRAPLLLTHAAAIDNLPETAIPIVPLDTHWPAITAEHPPAAPALHPDNIAYVISTSGSTGTPKGVQVSHRNLIAHVGAWRVISRPVPQDRLLQFASFTFDVFAQEMYTSLLNGLRLVHRSEDMIDPRELVARCGEWGITILNMPTTPWHELAARMGETGLRLPDSIRLVITGGEAAIRERVEQWRDHVRPGVQVINMYGPTEIAIACTGHDVASLPPGPLAFVPIGGPHPLYRAFITDNRLRLTPAGVPGELLIGGPGLARGYLNRPDLSAERFVPNPFSRQPGTRLYRTGDLVRWRELTDGRPTIEFVGRIDFQVKVRGYRIEMHEIES